MFLIIIGLLAVYFYFLKIYSVTNIDFSTLSESILFLIVFSVIAVSGKLMSYANWLHYKKANLISILFDRFLFYYIPLVAITISTTDYYFYNIYLVFLSVFLFFIWREKTKKISKFLWGYRFFGFSEISDIGETEKRHLDKLNSEVLFLYFGTLIGGGLIKFFHGV